MAPKATKPVGGETFVYVRMSTEDQEDSPQTQGQHTGDFITAHQLPAWTRTYFDLGISGKSVDKRPGIMALLRDAETVKPACIVFYKLDRAFRNAYEQAVALRRVKKLGIKILKVRDPNIDGPQGDLIDGILGHVNQFERELTGMRIRDHNQAMAVRGEWPGGIVPFGYAWRKAVKSHTGRKATTLEPGGMEPHPEEWPVARQLWDWALQGLRLAEILEQANTAGFRRRNGAPWTFTRMYLLYDSRVYAGYVPFGMHSNGVRTRALMAEQGEWHQGRHAPMVTDAEWRQVQESLRRGNPKQRAVRNPRAELAGLIRCRICGGSVSSSGALRAGHYSYVCWAAAQGAVSHPNWSRRNWLIHRAVVSVIREAQKLVKPHAQPDQTHKRREQLTREIGGLQQQIGRLRQLYVMGEYNNDLAAYGAEKTRLEGQITDRQRQLQDAGPSVDVIRERHKVLQVWRSGYAALAGDVLALQRHWRQVVEWVAVGPNALHVRLVDLGPAVSREWLVPLPPVGTKEPGSRHMGGIVGAPVSGRHGSYSAKGDYRPRPLVPVESHDDR